MHHAAQFYVRQSLLCNIKDSDDSHGLNSISVIGFRFNGVALSIKDI